MRAINHTAVVTATVRETPDAEYERRVGLLREQLAQWIDHRAAQSNGSRRAPYPASLRLSRFKSRLAAERKRVETT